MLLHKQLTPISSISSQMYQVLINWKWAKTSLLNHISPNMPLMRFITPTKTSGRTTTEERYLPVCHHYHQPIIPLEDIAIYICKIKSLDSSSSESGLIIFLYDSFSSSASRNGQGYRRCCWRSTWCFTVCSWCWTNHGTATSKPKSYPHGPSTQGTLLVALEGDSGSTWWHTG